ncbi:hypothetical protein AZE42_04706 [Rhizopogon vesiculosus]|uniref:Uncharacterized protein n=1 Tax=Rhizopogon vesiculosus TaxID=180088 RepID=A0A1J8QU37_9AGAM|nr:hypothetical protein AZE42_04706 [Rhizopogon vesiculosus]
MITSRVLKTLARTLSTAVRSTPELVGTAPPHRCYIFLHAPQPPSEYPAKYATPTQRALLLRTAKWGGSVNFAWSEDQASVPARAPGEEDKQEYHLTAFTSPRGKLEATVSMENVDEVGEQLRAHAEAIDGVSGATPVNSDDVHLYVCTHGARDCRCGDTGGAVAQAIRDELYKRRNSNPSDPSTRIKLAEVAHVGGHKYALVASILLKSDRSRAMLDMQQTSSCILTENGEVEPTDVPEILDAILALPVRPLNPDEIPTCPRNWRGRMGLSKDEQIQLFQQTYS